MSKSVIKVDKEVRHCDYCGALTEGMYSTCDCCHKDICSKHGSFAGEEDSYCYVCFGKGHNWIMEEMTRQYNERQDAWKQEKEMHKGQLKIDDVWTDRKSVLFDLNNQLHYAILSGSFDKVETLGRKITEMSSREY